jgi:hypothetical protein
MGGKMGGTPESMEGPEAAHGDPAKPAEGGLDSLMQTLQGVGEFLQSQGPQAKQAMGHFQALLQSMAQMGQGAPEMGSDMGEPEGPRRIHESQKPGVQVL